MEDSISLLVQDFSQDQNINYFIDIHGPKRMNTNYFVDPPTFPVVPPWGWHFWVFLVKCLDNYSMDIH